MVMAMFYPSVEHAMTIFLRGFSKITSYFMFPWPGGAFRLPG